jgi:uncharacterized protein (DUF111 family)
VCPKDKTEDIVRKIFEETTTFGMKINRKHGRALGISFKKVETPYGQINIKIGKYEGKIMTASPEYEDCKRAAIKYKVPIKIVYDCTKKG